MNNAVALASFAAAIVLLTLTARLLGLFWSALLLLAAVFAYLAVGFSPALPASLFKLYGATAVVAVILYATSSEQGRKALWDPLRRFLTQPDHRLLRGVFFVLLPGLLAWQAYRTSLPLAEAPPLIRSVHPSPPSEISFQGPGADKATAIDIASGDNPYTHLKANDPAAYATQVARGKQIYYENCYFCHGDQLAADGHFAPAIKPPPATFQSADVLPLLQATFLFWRIAKGGPGLPNEGTPWDSAMPVWENFLSAEDIWSVILFMSDYTGYEVRANNPEHADDGRHEGRDDRRGENN